LGFGDPEGIKDDFQRAFGADPTDVKTFFIFYDKQIYDMQSKFQINSEWPKKTRTHFVTSLSISTLLSAKVGTNFADKRR
jgi:hypothetical protein